MDMQTVPAILRPMQVCKILGISKATFWRLAKDDETFPKVFKLGPSASAVSSADLNRWLKAKMGA